MPSGRGGAVVNVLVAMQNGFPMMAHSGAARAGVENLSKSLASEWAPHGVRVNCVTPGTILGNGLKNYAPEVAAAVTDSDFASGSIPAGRLGTESECASAIVWLLSPGASYVTGVTLRVDGGVTLKFSGSRDNGGMLAYSGYVNGDALPGASKDVLQAYERLNFAKSKL